jgi:GNAT superfamily N-acetyltransferase
MQIRDAIAANAPAACETLRRSIVELCFADHLDDPVILKVWLANKTCENVAAWIARADSSLLVAVDRGAILGVGSVTDAGEITLNYVLPDARFRGVNRAMLRALEARAVDRGAVRCVLQSTETARRFYRANGYVDNGAPIGVFGARSGYPMAKSHEASTQMQGRSTRPGA